MSDTTDDAKQRRARTLAMAAEHEVIFDFVVTGQHPPPLNEDYSLLTSSEFTGRPVGSLTKIFIDEPLNVVKAAQGIVNRKGLSFSMLTHFVHEPSSRPFHPGSYFVWLFAHKFVKDAGKISDIFALPGPAEQWPAWAHSRARAIVFGRTTGGQYVHTTLTEEKMRIRPAISLAYRAQTTGQVRSWLKHEQHRAFCICPRQKSIDCALDLIFTLKTVEGTIVRIFVYFSQSDPDRDAASRSAVDLEVQRLMSAQLLAKPGTTLSGTQDEALRSLIPGATEKDIILRVMATFPNTFQPTSLAEDSMSTDQPAALRMDAAEKLSTEIQVADFARRMQDNVVLPPVG